MKALHIEQTVELAAVMLQLVDMWLADQGFCIVHLQPVDQRSVLKALHIEQTIESAAL